MGKKPVDFVIAEGPSPRAFHNRLLFCNGKKYVPGDLVRGLCDPSPHDNSPMDSYTFCNVPDLIFALGQELPYGSSIRHMYWGGRVRRKGKPHPKTFDRDTLNEEHLVPFTDFGPLHNCLQTGGGDPPVPVGLGETLDRWEQEHGGLMLQDTMEFFAHLRKEWLDYYEYDDWMDENFEAEFRACWLPELYTT